MSPRTRPLRLIVFGEQRSGTTLLVELLDAQPGVRVASGYLGGFLYTAFRELGLRADSRLSARQRHVLLRRAEDGAAEGLGELSVPEGQLDLDDLHRVLLGRLDDGDTRVVGHKVHGPIEAIESLVEADDVRCLCVVRDARDVILSRAYRGEQHLDEPLLNWLQTSERVAALRGHPRLLALRFEDLLRDPDSHLAALARLLELPPIEPPAGRPALQNSSFATLEAPFDGHALERWRLHAGERRVRYAQWLCRAQLRAWGYPIDAALRPRARERLHFMRRRAVLSALQLPRRAKNALLARALPALDDA